MSQVVLVPGSGAQRLFTDCALFFTLLLFWAPLCLVVGAKKYFFGALYKNTDGLTVSQEHTVQD